VPEEAGSLICPLEFRYGRPEARRLFSRSAQLRRALRVEAALAASEAEVGLIPTEAAHAIEAAASGRTVTLARVDALEAELRHDVMAMTRALAEESGAGGGWVHYGATSGDITDTALALELAEATSLLRSDLTQLARTLVDLAQRHRATPEIGRTHGQHAIPFSFGYKIAVGAAEVMPTAGGWTSYSHDSSSVSSPAPWAPAPALGSTPRPSKRA
jgi:adenylosuccinate lyase